MRRFLFAQIISGLLKMKVYAVARGRKIGIYSDWQSCEQQVKGYPNSCYKKLSSKSEALHFIESNKLTGK